MEGLQGNQDRMVPTVADNQDGVVSSIENKQDGVVPIVENNQDRVVISVDYSSGRAIFEFEDEQGEMASNIEPSPAKEAKSSSGKRGPYKTKAKIAVTAAEAGVEVTPTEASTSKKTPSSKKTPTSRKTTPSTKTATPQTTPTKRGPRAPYNTKARRAAAAAEAARLAALEVAEELSPSENEGSTASKIVKFKVPSDFLRRLQDSSSSHPHAVLESSGGTPSVSALSDLAEMQVDIRDLTRYRASTDTLVDRADIVYDSDDTISEAAAVSMSPEQLRQYPIGYDKKTSGYQKSTVVDETESDTEMEGRNDGRNKGKGRDNRKGKEVVQDDDTAVGDEEYGEDDDMEDGVQSGGGKKAKRGKKTGGRGIRGNRRGDESDMDKDDDGQTGGVKDKPKKKSRVGHRGGKRATAKKVRAKAGESNARYYDGTENFIEQDGVRKDILDNVLDEDADFSVSEEDEMVNTAVRKNYYENPAIHKVGNVWMHKATRKSRQETEIYAARKEEYKKGLLKLNDYTENVEAELKGLREELKNLRAFLPHLD